MIYRLRLPLITLLIVATVAFALQFTVDNVYTQNLIEKEINSYLEDNLELRLKYNTISISVVNPSVSVYGIQVKNLKNDDIALEASRIKITPYIIGFFLGIYKLDTLEVLDLKLKLPINQESSESQPQSENTEQKITWPPEWKIPANRIILKNANVASRSPKATPTRSLTYMLNGLDLDLQWRNHQKWNAKIDVKQISLAHLDTVLISRAKLRTKLVADGNKSIGSEYFSLESNRIDLNQSIQIDLDLKNEDFDPLSSLKVKQFVDNIFITIKGDIKKADLSILGDFLKAPKTFGTVHGTTKFTMNIPTNMRDIKWQLGINAASNKAILNGFKLFDSELEINITKDALYFENIRFKEDGKTLANANGKINFDDKISMQYEAQLNDIRLTKLLEILNVEDFSAIDANLNGQKIKISGQSFPYKLKISGKPKLDRVYSPIIGKKTQQTKQLGCDINLLLLIDIRALHFKDNNGLCYGTSENQKSPRVKASKINLNGKIGLKSSVKTDLSINLTDTYPEFINSFTPFKTSGKIDTKIHYHETQNDPVVDFAMTGTNLKIEKEIFSNLATTFSINPSKKNITIDNFHLSGKSGTQIQAGKSIITYAPKSSFEGDVDIRKVPSRLIYSMFGLLPTASTPSFLVHHFQGPLQLDIDNIRNTTASIKYDIKNLRIRDEILFESAEGFMKASNEEINLKADRISKKSIQLRLDASVKKAKPDRITDHPVLRYIGISDEDSISLKLENTTKPIDKESLSSPTYNEVNDLSSLPFVGKYFAETKSAADITIEIELEGKANDLKGRFSGGIYNAFLYESPIASTYCSGFIDGSKVNIPVIKHSGNSLIGRFNFDLAEQGIPYSWNFYLNQFDLRALLGKTFATDPRNYLYASASLNMEGKLNDWWNSSGSLKINEIAMNYTNDSFGKISQFNINSDEQIELVMTPKSWTFADNKALTIKSNLLDLKLSLEGNNPPNRIAAKVKSDFDIGLIKRLLPEIETAEGKVTVETTISRSIDNPKVDITARNYMRAELPQDEKQKSLKIGIAGIPPAFEDIKFQLDYKNGLINIRNMTANKGKEGSVKISGIVVTDKKKAQNINSRVFVDFESVEINQLQYSIFQNTNIVMSGQMSLSGNQPPFKVKGDINIDKANSINDFDIRKELVDTLYQGSGSSSASSKKNLVELDLSIKAENSLYIRNKNLEATLGGDMIIQGSEVTPTIIGQITSSSGTFNYKQKFELMRSVISFEDPSYPPNPNLDIVGQTNIDNYNVEVTISGPVSEPQVNFTIDPATRSDGTPISKVDIIMLLTSGKLPTETNQSPIKIASSEALSLLVGFAEGPLEEIFDASGQSFIRQIYLDSYLSETEARPVTRLNLPVDINNDLRVILQVDDDENFKLSSQYYLHENISVSGSFDKPKESKINESERNLPTDTVVDLKFRFGFE